MGDTRPVVEHTLSNFTTLNEIEKWAAQARALGFPDASPIDVRNSLGSVNAATLAVRAYLDRTDWPDESDEAEPEAQPDESAS